MAEHISASEARSDFRGTLNRVAYGHERLVITRHNDEEVAVIPVEDLRLLEELELRAEDAADAKAVGDMIAENPNYAEESVSLADLKRELDL